MSRVVVAGCADDRAGGVVVWYDVVVVICQCGGCGWLVVALDEQLTSEVYATGASAAGNTRDEACENLLGRTALKSPLHAACSSVSSAAAALATTPLLLQDRCSRQALVKLEKEASTCAEAGPKKQNRRSGL